MSKLSIRILLISVLVQQKTSTLIKATCPANPEKFIYETMLLHRFYYFHAVVTELLRVYEYGNGAMTMESGENDAIKLSYGCLWICRTRYYV